MVVATADAEGRPDCSYKSGMPGFIRVTGPSELAFPDYDGNGMFKSLGNVLVNPNVGLPMCCCYFTGKPFCDGRCDVPIASGVFCVPPLSLLLPGTGKA
jgi:hypothetical protein